MSSVGPIRSTPDQVRPTSNRPQFLHTSTPQPPKKIGAAARSTPDPVRTTPNRPHFHHGSTLYRQKRLAVAHVPPLIQSDPPQIDSNSTTDQLCNRQKYLAAPRVPPEIQSDPPLIYNSPKADSPFRSGLGRGSVGGGSETIGAGVGRVPCESEWVSARRLLRLTCNAAAAPWRPVRAHRPHIQSGGRPIAAATSRDKRRLRGTCIEIPTRHRGVRARRFNHSLKW